MARRRRWIDRGPQPSVAEPRPVLLREVLAFVQAAAACRGVRRIALLGSLATDKPIPKDADVLVTIGEDVDFETLAQAGRRLNGKCQAINLRADIFLCEPGGRYLGRVCQHRECHYRASCDAQNCGARQHLRDDLHVVTLAPDLVREPPFELWPALVRRAPAPSDVERLLLSPLEARRPGSQGGE